MDPHLLFVVFIPLPLVLADIASDIKSTYWSRNVSANNLVFADHLLWSMTSRSTVECAEICSEDVNCTTFTFTEATSEALRCRGHSQQMTSGGTITAGTNLYNLDQPDGVGEASQGPYYLGSTWLTQQCSDNSECSQPYTECFASQCLCTPGYYFSSSQDACYIGCSDLQQTFVHYSQRYISLNNMNDDDISLSACHDWCLSMSQCVSFEYNYETSRCYVAAVTVLDVPSAWTVATTNLSYWQRTCV